MDVSSIASLSVYMSQQQLLQNVGTAVLDMAMEDQVAEVSEMTASLESLVDPGIGNYIDIAL